MGADGEDELGHPLTERRRADAAFVPPPSPSVANKTLVARIGEQNQR